MSTNDDNQNAQTSQAYVASEFERDHKKAVRAIEVSGIPEIQGLSPENAVSTLAYMVSLQPKLQTFAVLAVHKHGDMRVHADAAALKDRPIDDQDREIMAARGYSLVPVYKAVQEPSDDREMFKAWNNDTDCPLVGLSPKNAAWRGWQARAVHSAPNEGEPPMGSDPASHAIAFALEGDDGLMFLRNWNEGKFDICRKWWPNAPKECYINADPSMPETGRLSTEQDSLIKDLPQFPTMLRKMWSGTEVQAWIDENLAPHVQHPKN